MKDTGEIEQLLLRYGRQDFTGQQEVWNRLNNGTKSALPNRRAGRFLRRSILAVAALMLVATTTVFAGEIIEVLQQMLLGDVNVTQYQKMQSEYDGTELNVRTFYEGAERVTPMLPEDIENFSASQWVNFATVEELQQQLPFQLKQAVGYTLESAAGWQFYSGLFDETARLVYSNGTVEQTYVGGNCTLNIQTVESLDEFIQVNIAGWPAIYSTNVGLHWVDTETGVAYIVNAPSFAKAKALAMALYP